MPSLSNKSFASYLSLNKKKVVVFAISGAIAGIAGALYTVQTGIITPSIMKVAFSIEMVIWVAVGGRGTLIGAIIGTLLVRLAQTFLSD